MGATITTDLKNHEVINQVIQKNGYETYLEIGCGNGDTGKNIDINFMVGVDIIPTEKGVYNVFHETYSDKFFLNNKNKFDIVFVDGANNYVQIMKDFLHSWAITNKNGCVIIPNCFPRCKQDTEIGYFGEAFKTLESIDAANFRHSLVRNDNGIVCVWKDFESRKVPNMINFDFETYAEKYLS